MALKTLNTKMVVGDCLKVRMKGIATNDNLRKAYTALFLPIPRHMLWAAERPIVVRAFQKYALDMLWVCCGCAVGREAAYVWCGPRSGPSCVWAAPCESVANYWPPRHNSGRSAADAKHGPLRGPQHTHGTSKAYPEHTFEGRGPQSAAPRPTAYATAYAAA